ncbi:MAG: hypothetical protein U5J64_00770 [Halobacteriales archaeon]|nr:hypothetical protein [Halobacteriales archaeon]
MIVKLAKAVFDILLGRVILAVGGLLLVMGVVFGLVYGRDALMALGLSRNVAGSIATVGVVAVCVYGLYLFATKAIDW